MPPTPPRGEVIDRVRRFNAVPGHVIGVAELIVFGSNLDPTKDRLGDLDLAIQFRDLLPDATPDERMKKRLAYSRASGQQFRHFNAELQWPEDEALLFEEALAHNQHHDP